jgi:hypothetical protein
MNLLMVVFGCALFSIGCQDLYGASPPYGTALSIHFNAPEIFGYATDSSGNQSGTDPNVSLDNVGQQIVNGIFHDLTGIPNSSVEQDNLDEGQSSTAWEIDIPVPVGNFTFSYSSADTNGTGEVFVQLMNYSTNNLTSNEIYLLAQNSTFKQINITVSQGNEISVIPVITAGSLLQDTQSACSLEEISPAEACEVLEAIALEVEKSITQGNTSAEAIELNLYLLVLNQLHNWGNAGSTQNWGNFNGYSECLPLCNKGLNGANFFAKDPAYSALDLDAQTLLNALPNQGISQGGGNQGNH